jgi:hypothetical protein
VNVEVEIQNNCAKDSLAHGGAISRVLYPLEVSSLKLKMIPLQVLIIYLGLLSPISSSSRLRDNNERVTLSHSDFAPSGVYLATLVTNDAGRLLPYRFTLTSCGCIKDLRFKIKDFSLIFNFQSLIFNLQKAVCFLLHLSSPYTPSG